MTRGLRRSYVHRKRNLLLVTCTWNFLLVPSPVLQGLAKACQALAAAVAAFETRKTARGSQRRRSLPASRRQHVLPEIHIASRVLGLHTGNKHAQLFGVDVRVGILWSLVRNCHDIGTPVHPPPVALQLLFPPCLESSIGFRIEVVEFVIAGVML